MVVVIFFPLVSCSGNKSRWCKLTDRLRKTVCVLGGHQQDQDPIPEWHGRTNDMTPRYFCLVGREVRCCSKPWLWWYKECRYRWPCSVFSGLEASLVFLAAPSALGLPSLVLANPEWSSRDSWSQCRLSC